MPGSAEEAIRSSRRAAAKEMNDIIEQVLPDYETSSAFRFLLDAPSDSEDTKLRRRSVPRDIADVSAVAQSLPDDVVVDAVTEQDVFPPEGDEPGNLQLLGAAVTDYRTPSKSAHHPSTEALLSAPRNTEARERAEQGGRALAKGWYAEAEQLFLDGAKRAPSDPLCWFGAGLAAKRLDRVRAANHMKKASQYLTTDDPSGSVYVAITAAALLESEQSTRDDAAAYLRRRADEIGQRCPALSLHLARLGVDPTDHMVEALRHDPLLAADVRALGLPPPPERFEPIERHLLAFDGSIADLNAIKVNGPPTPPGPRRPTWDPPGAEPMPLVRLERDLWKRVADCERAVIEVDRRVEEYAEIRRASERELHDRRDRAALDLTNEITVPFFARCVGTACFIVMLYFVGRAAASNTPDIFNPVIAVLVLLGVLLAIGYVVRAFMRSCWPYRHFEDARNAKTMIPRYQAHVAQQLNVEFELRLRRARAKGAADFRLTTLRRDRLSLVPRRPVFTASDLPLVPARR